jgi:hypothetical protein
MREGRGSPGVFLVAVESEWFPNRTSYNDRKWRVENSNHVQNIEIEKPIGLYTATGPGEV